MLSDRQTFLSGVGNQLARWEGPLEWLTPRIGSGEAGLPSSVLLLMGPHCGDRSEGFRPCLILNKRSRRVSQPGDLCCPGGSVSPQADSYLAKVLGLPGFPLSRWTHWRAWRQRRPKAARSLGLLLATSLRESFEEMRLNPLSVTFLGPLPPQRLIMFKRMIFPMVGWTDRQQRFFPNWEVDKIVRIPIDALLTPDHYGRYRFGYGKGAERVVKDYPCFTHHSGRETELLWGATYRIVMTFLEMVFGFAPPDPGEGVR